MARLWTNSIRGELSSGITDTDTTLDAAIFAELPVVSSPDTLRLTLDPQRKEDLGRPEIVEVTDHSSGSTTVTVARAVETGNNGGSAQAWPSGTTVVHGFTADEADDLTSHRGSSSNPHSTTAAQVGAAPTPHDLGGSHHGADTLANLNSKVSDATLISETSANDTYATVVEHGSDSTVARPSGAVQVLWMGTVEPDNGTTDDLLLRTDENALYAYDGSAWQSLGGGASDPHGDDAHSQAYARANMQMFTADGVFTVPPGIERLRITVVGAGGGGAGVDTSAVQPRGWGGAGGGAGAAEIQVVDVLPGDSISVTVGAGGSGGAGSSGTAGGDGGDGGTTSTSPGPSANGGSGGSGVASSAAGGSGTIPGGSGDGGTESDTSGISASSGRGGTSMFGGAGGGPGSASASVNGQDGSVGSGGSGGVVGPGNSDQADGGAGGDGIAIIEW